MKQLATYPRDVLFELVLAEETRLEFLGSDGKFYIVKTRSPRYKVFHKSSTCAVCGLKGTKMILEQPEHQSGSNNAHFNLYGIDEENNLILFTKDHILPSSLGGPNSIENYQTLCSKCNEFKENRQISNESLLAEIQAKKAANLAPNDQRVKE